MDFSSIYIFRGSVLFLAGLKSKSNLLLNSAFPLWNYALFTLTNELLSATNKYILRALQKSNVSYRFSSHLDSRYVGCASHRLQDRIKRPQIYPLLLFNPKILTSSQRCKSSTQTNTQSLASDFSSWISAFINPVCAEHLDDSRLSILALYRLSHIHQNF